MDISFLNFVRFNSRFVIHTFFLLNIMRMERGRDEDDCCCDFLADSLIYNTFPFLLQDLPWAYSCTQGHMSIGCNNTRREGNVYNFSFLYL